MATNVIRVCVFCLICATHTPCGSHAAIAHESPQIQGASAMANDPLTMKPGAREKFKQKELREGEVVGSISGDDNTVHSIQRRSDSISENETYSKDYFLNKLITMYGNGETISKAGLQNLLNDIHRIANPQNTTLQNKCIKLDTGSNLTQSGLDESCPALLYSILSSNCTPEKHLQHDDLLGCCKVDMHTWLYSIGAVVVISLCGVLSLFIIPLMQKRFYKSLIQFLLALAVGTLAGDALLHLLPHAMSGSHQHGGDGHEEEIENVWKGFVAMLALIVFFIMERFLPLIHRWRKGKPSKGHVKVLNSSLEINTSGDRQCMDKYNAYPRCFKDIVDDPNTTFLDAADNETSNTRLEDISNQKKINGEGHLMLEPHSAKENETNQNLSDGPAANRLLPRPSADYTVILNEHDAVMHHGHSHVHGHVHAAPQNFSSVAWMVIMGDGLHNFTDGMAIGAAFSGSLAGGFSTTVAVLCHELPHEIGDFAMLLKAGMSIKQAFFYNIISSVLCILGNLLGVYLGNIDSASSWVFAVAAGTFIYIALVDMIPELSSAHEDQGNLMQCVLHLSGLFLGFGIMTLIALYEHDLKNIFTD